MAETFPVRGIESAWQIRVMTQVSKTSNASLQDLTSIHGSYSVGTSPFSTWRASAQTVPSP